MYKTIKTSDVAGCMNLMEDIIMQGRDLSQFVTDFVWYLRNLLLIKTTDDIDKIEDVIEVSKDNIKDMIEDARDVDVDSIMRHIRVLSELSNEMKYATQKRVKAEVAFIKLMKPAMESPKDMQELAGRVNDLENQLSEALSKLQSGAYITKDMLDNMSLQSGGALGTGSRNDAVQEEKPVLRRNYDAVTDDIKQIAGQWSQIVASMDDALLMNLLKQADVTVTEDGNSLEIMVKSISGYNVISREETIAKIEELIEERTGISVRVVCTRIDEDEDFNRRYIALEELVGMDIEIDDKEEFI
jgi:DNA polymerase-3 subunit gamma/tau